MEEIIKAHKAYREAYNKVWHNKENPKAARWDSEERKELQKAEDAFNKAVSDSEYDEMFSDYASLNDSQRWL